MCWNNKYSLFLPMLLWFNQDLEHLLFDYFQRCPVFLDIRISFHNMWSSWILFHNMWSSWYWVCLVECTHLVLYISIFPPWHRAANVWTEPTASSTSAIRGTAPPNNLLSSIPIYKHAEIISSSSSSSLFVRLES